MTLATLGPAGSDSEHAAKLICVELKLRTSIVLLDTFHAALAHAKQNDGLALIPAAYTEMGDDASGRPCATWADTHFRIETEGQLELWTALVLPLKEFAIARRRDVEVPRTVSLHPAMSYHARRFLPDAAPHYHRSKPEAVRACANGVSDACLGSLDVVEQHPNLIATRTFSARMCWTIYRRRQVAQGQNDKNGS